MILLMLFDGFASTHEIGHTGPQRTSVVWVTDREREPLNATSERQPMQMERASDGRRTDAMQRSRSQCERAAIHNALDVCSTRQKHSDEIMCARKKLNASKHGRYNGGSQHYC